MAARPPATSHAEIIGAVAALQEQVAHLVESVGRLEGKVDSMSATVTGHNEQITEWKRDGKWLARALVGLGIIGGFVASFVRDWFLHWIGR
jgi:hypothetical protein